MQTLYNSASYVVVRFDVPVSEADPAPARGGFEIVDKFAGKEIYLEGALAESFQRGVQAIVAGGPSEDSMDDFIGRYAGLAQQPVLLH
jgi:hypothetical protein